MRRESALESYRTSYPTKKEQMKDLDIICSNVVNQIQESKSGLEDVVRKYPWTEEFVNKVLEWHLSKVDDRSFYLYQMFDTCFDTNGINFIKSFRSFVINCFLDDDACEIEWTTNEYFEDVSLPIVVRNPDGKATLETVIAAMDQKVIREQQLHQKRLDQQEKIRVMMEQVRAGK
jgi:hypothetical protein